MDKLLIGNKIRNARKLNNMTQEAVSEKVGIDNTYYGKIERGVGGLQFSTIVKIADVLGLSLDYLVLDIGENKVLSHEVLEIANLLSDCTHFEKQVITKSCASIKEALKNSK